MRFNSATLSLVFFLAGLVIFGLVNTRVISGALVLPGLGVSLLAALLGVIFGHRGFAEARRAGSGSWLALGSLMLCYLLLILVGVFTALLILAIRNFS